MTEGGIVQMTGNDEFQSFGETLLYYRKKEGFSQEQLAEGICSREYIGQIEKGKKILVRKYVEY